VRLYNIDCATTWVSSGDLLEHIRNVHPQKLAEGMPECRHCRMPCEAGRKPRKDWLCNYCGLWQSEAWCPVCGSQTTPDRIRYERIRELAPSETIT
jgi:hypothetical protein